MEANCKDCANVGECGVTKIGCAFYRSRENITEADRIRGMTDEELAEYVFELANYACPPQKTYAQLTCGKNPKCSDCWLDFLRKPVEKEDI